MLATVMLWLSTLLGFFFVFCFVLFICLLVLFVSKYFISVVCYNATRVLCSVSNHSHPSFVLPQTSDCLVIVSAFMLLLLSTEVHSSKNMTAQQQFQIINCPADMKLNFQAVLMGVFRDSRFALRTLHDVSTWCSWEDLCWRTSWRTRTTSGWCLASIRSKVSGCWTSWCAHRHKHCVA